MPELPQCRGKNKIECSLKEEVEAGATDQQEVDDRSADIICLHKSAQGAGDQQTAEHENTCVDNGRNESGSKGRRYAVSLTQQTEHKTGQESCQGGLDQADACRGDRVLLKQVGSEGIHAKHAERIYTSAPNTKPKNAPAAGPKIMAPSVMGISTRLIEVPRNGSLMANPVS